MNQRAMSTALVERSTTPQGPVPAGPPATPSRSTASLSPVRHSPRNRVPSPRPDGPVSKMNVNPGSTSALAGDSGIASGRSEEGPPNGARQHALGPPPPNDKQDQGQRDIPREKLAARDDQNKSMRIGQGGAEGQGPSQSRRDETLDPRAPAQQPNPHPVLQPQAQSYPIKMSEYPTPVPPPSAHVVPRIAAGSSTSGPGSNGSASRLLGRPVKSQTQPSDPIPQRSTTPRDPPTAPVSYLGGPTAGEQRPAHGSQQAASARHPPPEQRTNVQMSSEPAAPLEAPAKSTKPGPSKRQSQQPRLPPAKNNLRAGDTVTDPKTPHIHGCPFCDKVYTGQHARSICRRHQMSKHGIELEVQVKKSRWDNNPNRPATEAEKHKRTLESKRRWAAKDRRRRRAEKRGEQFNEDEEGDGPYTDEEDYDDEDRSASMSQEPRGRGASHATEDSQPNNRPIHRVVTYRAQAESDRSVAEESDVDMEDDRVSVTISEVPSAAKLRRNMPISTERGSDRLAPEHAETRQSGRSSRRGRSRDASTASTDRASMRSDAYYQQEGQPQQQYIQQNQPWPPAGPARYASSGQYPAYMAVPAIEHFNGQGERILVYATAVQHPDGSITYHAPAPAIYQPTTYASQSSSSTRPSAPGRPAQVSHRTARRNVPTGEAPAESSSRSSRPEGLRRQGSQSFSRPPMPQPDDTVFNAGPSRGSKRVASGSKAPTTPSKKRKKQEERRESESDEEAAKVLLAISASPARPGGGAVNPVDRQPRASTSRDSSADKPAEGKDAATPRFKEVPGAKDLVEEDRTPVRPYNGPSLGAHGRKASAATSGSAGGLWAASVRRKSISEQRPPAGPSDVLEPPSLRKSNPSSSASRREMDSEPLTPGELDPPVEIVTVERNPKPAAAPAYRDVQDPFSQHAASNDPVLSSPLAYSKSALAAQAAPVLHQTSSLRSQTGLSTLAAAARINTTPARERPVHGSASRSTGRGGIGFGDSPAGLFGFNPFSSPSGPGELTAKLGLAPTPANVPESPGWLDVVRETPVALRAAKRNHAKKGSEGSSSENSDKERRGSGERRESGGDTIMN